MINRYEAMFWFYLSALCGEILGITGVLVNPGNQGHIPTVFVSFIMGFVMLITIIGLAVSIDGVDE